MRRLLASAAFLLLLCSCTVSPTAPSPAPSTTVASTMTAARISPTSPPTAAPTTSLPTPLRTIIPTKIPSPTRTARPSITPLPTFTIPSLRGTLYVQRNREIVAVNLESLVETPLGIRADSFHVSPDGTQLAYLISGTLRLADAWGRDAYQLLEGTISDFRWAPDSHAIAVVKTTDPSRDCSPSSEIWVIELPGGETRVIDKGCEPVWSPDGLRLAYVSSYKKYATNQPPNALYLVNRYGQHRWSPYQAGGREGFSADSPNRKYLYQPFWSADGSALFVATFVDPGGIAGIFTLEMVDSYRGESQTIAVFYALGSIFPSPDRNRILLVGGWAEWGAHGARVFFLLGDEYGCEGWFRCPGPQLRLRTREEMSLEQAWGAAWSPDGEYVAISYCPGQVREQIGEPCYRQPALAELRLIEPETRAVSPPLLMQVDFYGVMDWTPP